MIKSFGRTYQLISILSLDVAVGAVISALFFARVFTITLYPQGLLVLAVTVWLIYTADHLLDARRVKRVAASDRHRFHQDHFKILTAVLLLFSAVDFYLIFFVRSTIVVSGLYLSFAVIAYLLLSRWLVYLKEVVAGLLYTAGVLLPSWSVYQGSVSNDQWFLIFQFGVVVWINLMLFAWMGYEQDKNDSQKSIATLLGKQTTRHFLIFLFILQLGLTIQSMNQIYKSEIFLLATMTLVLLVIFLMPNFFQRHDRFRWVGDSVFFLPVSLVL